MLKNETRKNTYLRHVKDYNTKQIPSNLKAYLQSEFGFNQAQMRCLMYLIADKSAHTEKSIFKAFAFKGAVGLKFKDNPAEFLHEFHDYLKANNYLGSMNWWLTYAHYDTATAKAIPYSIRFYLSEDTEAVLFALLNNTEDKLVPLTDEPVKDTMREYKPKAKKEDAVARATTEDSIMQPTLDYLHSRRVKMAINKLATRNGVEKSEVEEALKFHAVSGTDRVFSNGKVLNDRVLRAKLFTGCYYIDICHSQLSIFASRENAPLLTEALKGDIWQMFADHLNVPLTAENKSDIKHDCVYAALNGRTEDTLEKKTRFGRALLSNPVFREILDVATDAREYLIAGGMLISQFGTILKVNPESKISVEDQARSLYCKYITSFEQWIIQEVFVNYIAIHKDIVVPGGYLSDGIYITSSHHPEKLERYCEIVGQKISEVAKSIGIDMKCSTPELVTPTHGLKAPKAKTKTCPQVVKLQTLREFLTSSQSAPWVTDGFESDKIKRLIEVPQTLLDMKMNWDTLLTQAIQPIKIPTGVVISPDTL